MSRCLAYLLFAAALTLANPPVAAELKPPRRLALVIGNADYVHAGSLRNPRHDAVDICEALRQQGFAPVCLENLPTAAVLQASIRDYAASLGPADVGVFYYAGHAVQIHGDNYLIPTEATLRSLAALENETVNLRVLMQALGEARNSLNLVVLDACRDNPWAGQLTRQGLARMDFVPAGTMVLYATGANEAAFDGSGRNGTLTRHFLQHIATPRLGIEDMLKRVSQGVQGETLLALGRKQVPYVYTSFTGEFCFAGCAPKSDLVELQRQHSDKQALENRLDAEVLAREAEGRRLRAELDRLAGSDSSDEAVFKRSQQLQTRHEANEQAAARVRAEASATRAIRQQLASQIAELQRQASQADEAKRSSRYLPPPPL